MTTKKTNAMTTRETKAMTTRKTKATTTIKTKTTTTKKTKAMPTRKTKATTTGTTKATTPASNPGWSLLWGLLAIMGILGFVYLTRRYKIHKERNLPLGTFVMVNHGDYTRMS